MAGGGSRDAGENFSSAEAAIGAGILLAEQAPKIAAHGKASFRRIQQGRRPFDRVDLGDESGVDEPRLLEQPLAIGGRMVDAQPIDDGIVLAREQRVHHRQADPPVAVHSGKLLVGDVACRIDGKMPAFIEMQLAVRAHLPGGGIRAHRALDLQIRAVDLRGIPPMRLGIAIGRGLTLVGGGMPVIRQRVQDGHVGRGPVVAGRQRQAMRRRRGIAAAVAQPVVHHELQPRRDENAEMGHRREAAAREQITTHLAWIGLVEIGRLFAKCVADRHIAAEARASHAHPRATEIVVTAVGRALVAGTVTALRLEQRWIAFGIRKVVLAHINAIADQRRHREQEGKPVPDAESIGQCGETSEQTLAKRNGHVAPPLDFALTSMTSWPLRSPGR